MIIVAHRFPTWKISTVGWVMSNGTENSGQMGILVGNIGFWY